MVDDGQVHVLDVREDHEHSSGHIEDSQNIYVGNLMKRLEEIPKTSFLCTSCSGGYRSGIASSILKKNGYKVANLLGGMKAWKNATMSTVIDPDYDKTIQRVPTCPN